MRLPLTTDQSDWVPLVFAHGALPLIRDWFSTVGLRPDGEVVQWNTDDPPEYDGVIPVDDRYIWLSALVNATRTYPQLHALLPARPPIARDCLCIGLPLFAEGKVLCPKCCGLRWVVENRFN